VSGIDLGPVTTSSGVPDLPPFKAPSSERTQSEQQPLNPRTSVTTAATGASSSSAASSPTAAAAAAAVPAESKTPRTTAVPVTPRKTASRARLSLNTGNADNRNRNKVESALKSMGVKAEKGKEFAQKRFAEWTLDKKVADFDAENSENEFQRLLVALRFVLDDANIVELLQKQEEDNKDEDGQAGVGSSERIQGSISAAVSIMHTQEDTEDTAVLQAARVSCCSAREYAGVVLCLIRFVAC